MGRRENIVEDYIIQRAKELGGFTRKVTYQGRSGSPDQWCFFPNERLIIIEAKAKGEKPEPLQLEEMRKLRAQGFRVDWADTKEKVNDIFTRYL